MPQNTRPRKIGKNSTAYHCFLCSFFFSFLFFSSRLFFECLVFLSVHLTFTFINCVFKNKNLLPLYFLYQQPPRTAAVSFRSHLFSGIRNMAAVHLSLSLLLLSLSFLIHPSFSQNRDSLALLNFKDSLTNSDSLTDWKDEASSPCASDNVWNGIVCTMDTVSTINLANMGLQGRPDVGALAPLDGLESINLDNNSLDGSMPMFNRIPSLKSIYASNNQFSGKIPADYFQTLGLLKKLWLSNNRFSGPISMSIGELSDLKELHLDHNEFTGPIPEFQYIDVLNDLDLSNNNLEGPVPEQMNKFDAASFENNTDLCGPKTLKRCPIESEAESKSFAKWIITAIVLTLLIMILFAKTKRQQENMRILGKQRMDQATVTIPTTTTIKRNGSVRKTYINLNNNKSTDLSTRSRKGESQLRRLGGDMVMVNEERGVFGLHDLMTAEAEVLGNGGLGSAYKATLGTGMSVVVKRVKEMNEMTKDMFDTEMRKMGRLKHPNILTPLAYHFRNEEKLLVSEYVPNGSLLYVLHGDRGMFHSELHWPNRLKIIKGVARGMSFLHSEFASYELPHGNLKSCNVLIGQDYEPLLSDYALHPLINNTPTAQCMIAYRSPEATLRQQVSHKSDVYCLGIIILEIITGKYPSQYMNNQKGGTDVVQWVRSALDEKREAELIDPDLASSVEESVGQMEKLLHIGAACTESEVDQRIDMKEAVRRIGEISV